MSDDFQIEDFGDFVEGCVVSLERKFPEIVGYRRRNAAAGRVSLPDLSCCLLAEDPELLMAFAVACDARYYVGMGTRESRFVDVTKSIGVTGVGARLVGRQASCAWIRVSEAQYRQLLYSMQTPGVPVPPIEDWFAAVQRPPVKLRAHRALTRRARKTHKRR